MANLYPTYLLLNRRRFPPWLSSSELWTSPDVVERFKSRYVGERRVGMCRPIRRVAGRWRRFALEVARLEAVRSEVILMVADAELSSGEVLGGMRVVGGCGRS